MKKALIVDDIPMNLSLLDHVIHTKGCKTISATNGEEAIDIYINHHKEISIIFMDIKMPIMDGIKATKIIRQFEEDNNLPKKPIIALTAYMENDTKKEATIAGCNEFITKPFDINELMEKAIKYCK